MVRPRGRLALVLLAGLTLSCGGGGSSPTSPGTGGSAGTTSCTTLGQCTFVRDALRDYYYWYKELPSPDPASFSSPEAYLDAVRYRPLDSSFSYVTSKAASDAFYSDSQFIGFGLSYKRTADTELRLAQAFPGSPAADAGHGPRGHAPDHRRQGGGGPHPDGRDQHRLRGRAGGCRRDVHLAGPRGPGKGRHPGEAQGHDPHRVPDRGAERRRHPGAATSTSATSSSPRSRPSTPPSPSSATRGRRSWSSTCATTAAGSSRSSQHLAGLIGGSPLEGQVFVQFTHNDKQSSRNVAYRFEAKPQALGVSRLVVITTRGSASASEAIINGLRPFMDVKVVGDTTYGKPVGQYGFDFCEKVLYPVAFLVTNARARRTTSTASRPTAPPRTTWTTRWPTRARPRSPRPSTCVRNGRCSGTAAAQAEVQARFRERVREIPQDGWRQTLNAW